MFQCENGHTVCFDEAVTDLDEAEEQAEKECKAKGEEFDRGEFYYEAPESVCPICSMIAFSQSDLKAYLKKLTNITDDEVFKIVKEANRRRRKLYDSEYVDYATKKVGLTAESLKTQIKDKFKTYSEFMDFCD